jgi:hypothetical protein
MLKAAAVLLGLLLPLLGFADAGHAQSSLQIQGTIQGVDCQAETVVLDGPAGTNTIAATGYTAVLVNSTSVPFCTLQEYVGAPATAVLVASGNELEVAQIYVTGQPAFAPPPPPAPASVVVAPAPIVGIVLGTIIVAGLAYLLVRDYYGGFYRYPYYGPYYRYYYRPAYRPYVGPYHDAPVRLGDIRWAAPAYRDSHHLGSPGYSGSGGRDPVPQDAPRWTPPATPRQSAPAYYNPNWTPPAYQNDRGQHTPGGYGGSPQCGGRGSNQSCTNVVDEGLPKR